MRFPPKKSKPRRGIREGLPDQPSASFVTLRFSQGGIDKILSFADDSMLRWYTKPVADHRQSFRNEISRPGPVERTQSSEDEAASALPATIQEARCQPQSHARTQPQARVSVRRLLRIDVPAVENEESLQTPTAGVPTITPQTPALQTPSIKLKLGSIKARQDGSGLNDHGSAAASIPKKRKIAKSAEAIAPAPPKPIQKLKLTTKNASSGGGPRSAVTPGIRLKTKGKIPKRPLGVGYDSELEDREVDPVILEAMVLRMQPGPDCDYIRQMISEGKIGVSVLQGGASINLRLFDQDGRRGMMTVRGNQYAISVVDLPTITEGMKSWNKKDWMKSVDISQMCLVLGPCNGEEEARNYRLHSDINPKTYQYAHGLTAPMHWVRKRRFDKTSRHRLDNIERIERRLNALLAGDAAAAEVKWQVLDYNPLERGPEGEDDENEGSEDDSDAEGEVEDGYFPTPPNIHQYRQDEIADLEAALMEDEPGSVLVDSVIADSTMVSEAQSPAVDTSAAATPAALPSDPADAATPDNVDDDDDDVSSNEGAEVDAGVSEAKAAKLEKLREIEKSIADKEKAFKQCASNILRKKIAVTIQKLQADRDMALRELGMGEGETGGGQSEEE